MSILSKEIFTFIEVARQRSVRGAAERLNISASALSRQVQILEGDLGVTLLTRHSNGVALTEQGEKLLLHAERMIAMENGLRDQVKEFKGKTQIDFNLGVMESIAHALVPKLRYRLAEIDERLCLNIIVDGTQNLVSRLTDRHLDCIVAFNIPTDEHIRIVDVFDLQIGLVCRQGHFSDPPTSIDLRACLAWPLCLPSKDLSLHVRLLSEIHRQKQVFRVAATSNSFVVLRGLIAGGAGVGFMTLSDLLTEPDSNQLIFVPLRDRRLSEKLCIATLSSFGYGSDLGWIIRHVQELVRQIAQQ